MPKRYQDKTKYDFFEHKVTRGTVYRLCHISTKQPVIKNPIAVGTPKEIKINFQKIWNNEVTDHTRNKISTALKESYEDILSEVEPIGDGFPLKTFFIFHTKEELQDIDNLSFLYIKTFHDALVGHGIIPDDKLKYIKSYEVDHEPDEEEYIEVRIYSLDDKGKSD